MEYKYIYQLKNLFLKIKTLTTISTYFHTIIILILNISKIMFALTPYANWYNNNVIIFLNSDDALTNLITLYLTKDSNYFIKYIIVS
jgi:hypothetical protein